ncbi:hypothetical protein M422DRAFT_27126 [Sphaerobolus stellatus SS14]|nr:hypothetical protein M422DRAFT_27126 [Sphaerobolus stellatus SS14]
MAQNIRQAEGLLRTVPTPGQIVLPKDGETNILITSALPYCNNVPHLGNIIGSTLSADVFSRYSRSRNRRTLYVCGTDEYGTATETQALKEGISPKALCDKYHRLHRQTYDWFDIGFDHFGRTSTEWHTKITQDIYLHLNKNNLLEKQVKDQTYCEGCSRFLADRLVEGTCPHCKADDARGDQCDVCSKTLDPLDLINPRCQRDKTHKIVSRPSTHMYVKLNEIQPQLEEWIKKTAKEGKWSPNVIINSDGEIIDSRVRGGLRPSPVTRDLRWGVPVPPTGDEALDAEMKDKVMYVWFDAPIGYPSITANYTPEWEQWWFNPKNVKLYQFMGKDNAYFHIVFFPSVLLGDGRDWTKLHHISTTEFLNYEGGKFSKSRNRGVFGPAAKETGLSPSVWRYYLLSTRPETSDSMFSWSEFVTVNNAILLNNFGNFVNRAIKFIAAKFDGVIPDGGDAPGDLPLDDLDSAFVTEVNQLIRAYIEAMDAVKIRLGLQTVMLISARGNLYLQQSGLGNALLAENPKRCAQVLSRAINLIYALSAIVYPFMPSTAEAMLDQLNAPARAVPDVLGNDILPGHKIGTPDYLFKKIDEKQAEIWRAQFGGAPAAPEEAAAAVGAAKGPAGISKRKAAVASKAAAKATKVKEDREKTEAELELETKIKAQGDVVRTLKEKQKKKELEDEAELSNALAELLKLKASLTEEQAKN